MSASYDCAIINTGAGNLTSLYQAILSIGKTAIIINDANAFESTIFSNIIIPGQGHFGSVMTTLNQKKISPLLQQWKQDNKPILGICVGMQIFFEGSDEDPEVTGFGWLSGRAKTLNFPKKPMVGWCEVQPTHSFLTKGNAYFVNSFGIKFSDFEIAQTTYGEVFCSAIKKNNLIGVQFHPEKSSHYGLEVIKICLDY